MIPHPNITDDQRMAFLHKLKASELILSRWEKDFVSGATCATHINWFSDGRRVATDKMRMLYGNEPEIAMPFPLAETSAPATPKASAHCCMFLKRDDERQLRPCNEPAELIGGKGFLYCRSCGEEARKQMKRRNINMVLRSYAAKPMASGGLTT